MENKKERLKKIISEGCIRVVDMGKDHSVQTQCTLCLVVKSGVDRLFLGDITSFPYLGHWCCCDCNPYLLSPTTIVGPNV
jgi:hypothetical protein